MSATGIWVCVFVLLVTCCEHLMARHPDSKGTEFILSYMDNHGQGPKSGRYDVELLITTESLSPVIVVVTTPLFNPSWSKAVLVDRNYAQKVTIPYQIRGNGTEKANKGVYVKSTKDITVVGVNKELSSTAAFLLLPVDVLGSRYYTVTLKGQPELMIVGIYDYTRVSVTWPANMYINVTYNGVTYRAGDTLRLVLDKYQTFHAFQDNKLVDFTGAYVDSDKPVAVFSGNRHVSLGGKSADHIAEMLKPVKSWGTTFFTTNIGDRTSGDTYKFVASEDNTTVDVHGGGRFYIPHAGSFVESLKPATVAKMLLANKPVLVAVISQSQSADDPNGGDPSMILDIPSDLYSSNYTWGTPEQADGLPFNNTITVIINTEAIRGLTLDGVLPKWDGQQVITGTNHSHLWKYIGPGTHHLFHVNPDVRFFAVASGRVTSNSYAYLTGMRLTTFSSNCSVTLGNFKDGIDNDCDGHVDEEIKNGIDDDGDGEIDEDLGKTATAAGNVTYRCEVCKDPHAHTFSGLSYSLPIPCAYVVTQLILKNRLRGRVPHYHKILLEVLAGNSRVDIRGRYFVSDVTVKVTLVKGRERRSNTYITGFELIQSGNIWNITKSDNMQGRVEMGYNETENLAELWITHSSLRVQFRPVNTSQNLHQELKPGVFVQVGSMDLIYDDNIKFPNTMCSTINDSTSIKEYAKLYNATKHTVGLYAVTEQLQFNISSWSDQDDLCPTVLQKYDNCYQQTYAFNTCISLPSHASTVHCINRHIDNVDVMNVVDLCLDYRCHGDTLACQILMSYNETCHDIASLLDLQYC